MTDNLAGDLLRRAAETPDAVLVRRPSTEGEQGQGGWTDVTAAAFADEVRATAAGLVEAGVRPGDRVLLFAQTRYEWTLVDYAIWTAGGITVPAYPSTDGETLAFVVRDSEPVLAIADSSARGRRLAEVAPGLPTLVIEEGSVGVSIHRPPAGTRPTGVANTRPTAGGGEVDPNSPATIIYASGTTGEPRGCVLSHRALLAAAETMTAELGEVSTHRPDASTIILLPLAHVLARVQQVACVHAGVPFAHGQGPHRLTADLAELRPTFLVGVPRLFEGLYTRAYQHMAGEGRSSLFNRATESAIAYSRALDSRSKGGPGIRLRARHALFDRAVYAGIRGSLGGRCTVALCSGAPLGERLGHFFRGIGVPLLEGFGLTETAGTVVGNTLATQRIGTVGRPLGATELRLEEDGELLVRAPQLLSGYWHDDEATAAVLRHGWFHTGDLGELDEDGYLVVTGRKREVIVTAGGKHVPPNAIEERIRAHPLVDRALVVGDGRPYVGALITLDPETFDAWRRRTGKKGGMADLVDDHDLRGAVKVAVEQANRSVSPAEAVRRFAILPTRWTEAGGQLTPSQKLRRDVVTREHRAEIEALFAS